MSSHPSSTRPVRPYSIHKSPSPFSLVSFSLVSFSLVSFSLAFENSISTHQLLLLKPKRRIFPSVDLFLALYQFRFLNFHDRFLFLFSLFVSNYLPFFEFLIPLYPSSSSIEDQVKKNPRQRLFISVLHLFCRILICWLCLILPIDTKIIWFTRLETQLRLETRYYPNFFKEALSHQTLSCYNFFLSAITFFLLSSSDPLIRQSLFILLIESRTYLYSVLISILIRKSIESFYSRSAVVSTT